MKKFSFNPMKVGKWFIVPALAIVTVSIHSCKKDSGVGSATPTNVTTLTSDQKAAKLNNSVEKALRDFVISGASSNTNSGAGAGSNTYSNVSINVTTYTTPNANVYAWTDPTSGTSFTFSEANTGTGGGGLGQLSYNGKSFDYNYVMCIKADAKDPMWDGFLNGRDLRGVVAIDGKLTGTDFSLKNLAIFLVATKGGEGKYDFIDWDSQSLTMNDAIGELLDFSDVDDNSLAGMDKAKFLITSDGSVEVAENEFIMGSDAKIKDVITEDEFKLEGSISCE